MAKVIHVNFAEMLKKKGTTAAKSTEASAFQLKVSLLYSEPLIWRRIHLPASMTLAQLHTVIQICMGWTDSHLHQFRIGSNFYGPANLDDGARMRTAFDESRFTLAKLETQMQQQFIYDYDFGDGWQHELQLEKKIGAVENTARHPILLAGERACPPEDIGGIPGYEDFLATINDPKSKAYEEVRDWYGTADFDPDYIALDAINSSLRNLK